MKEQSINRFTILAIVFTVCIIASNLFETKIFSAFGLTLTGGLLLFPISYIVNDILAELYGYRKARTVILTAFVMNLAVVLIAQLVRLLPPAPFWDGQEHFDYIFTADLRISIASMTAFLVGSLSNAFIMDRMKNASKDGKGFGTRAVVSTLAGESLDSLIFFPIAFWPVGMKNIVIMMLTQIVLKTLYEVVVLPLTSRLVTKAKENGLD